MCTFNGSIVPANYVAVAMRLSDSIVEGIMMSAFAMEMTRLKGLPAEIDIRWNMWADHCTAVHK